MAKLVVSTWSRSSFQQQFGRTFANRGEWLKEALKATASRIAAANYESSGLIKGIFVAPEYFFAAKWAGLKLKSGRQLPRPIGEDSHNTLLKMLVGLSQKYPRILMLPGTVAWKKPIDLHELNQRLHYYQNRAAKMPPLSGMQLYRALSGEYQRSRIDGSLVDSVARTEYSTAKNAVMLTDVLSESEFDQIRTSDPAVYAMMVATVNANQSLGSAAIGMANRWTANSHVIRETMQNTAYALLNGRVVHAYAKQGNFHEEAGDRSIVFAPGARSGVQEIEGIRFGLEICLDHCLGTLSRQLRSGREIDVQIVMSDWVQYNPGHAVVRDGGYFIHASTNSAMTGVWQIKNRQSVKAPSLGVDKIAGTGLEHYEMDLDFDEPLNLDDLFKEPQTKAGPKKWPTVTSPQNPFRGRG